jgi:spermidine/putrescine transport system permease protein
LATPGTIWLVLFFLIPISILFTLSVSDKLVVNGETSINDYDYLTGITNYLRALDPNIISIFLRTLWWSALSTVACLLIGYPLAFGICFAPEKSRPLLLLLIILPFWINLLIRTYALKTTMGANGIINWILEIVGIGPVSMLGTTPAVIFGLVYVFLPFMVLPLYSTIERLDRSFLEASLDLGATQAQTFWRVTFPLTMPGVVTGVILVFIPCLGMFLISDELGGASSWMIGNVIQKQFGSSNDWPFGSALSFILMFLTFAVLFLQWLYQRRSKGASA